MTRRRMCLTLTCGLLATAFQACSSRDARLCPVTGTVVYRGQPVEGAAVAFRPQGGGQLVTGTTDAQGRFKLTTFKLGDGARPGKYVVSVSKYGLPGAAASSRPVSMDEAAKAPPAVVESRNALPAKYADPTRSAMELEVRENGANDFKIELTD